MTIRDLVHLLLTAKNLDKDVVISSHYRADISHVQILENGDFLIYASGYNKDKISVKTKIEVKHPHDKEPTIF